MVEQPPRNPEIERHLDGKLLDSICDQIRQKDLTPRSSEERQEGASEEAPPLRLANGARFFYCNSYVANEDLKDALERPLESLHVRGRRALLLLVDPDPAANWAHPCWIASIDVDRGEKVRVVRNNYPPLETPQLRLVRFAALHACERE